MTKQLLLAAFLCAGYLAGSAPAQAQGLDNGDPAAYEYDNELYTLTPTECDWDTAESEAVAMGGQLVSITSPGIENFLISTFLADDSPEATRPLWIGLEASIPGDTSSYTTWTDGAPVSYTDWNPGEPNNLNGDEDYVALNWHYSFGSSDVKGTWDDLPLNGSTVNYGGENYRALGPYYGIVQIPVAVPEPASTWLLVAGGSVLGLGFVRRRRVA